LEINSCRVIRIAVAGTDRTLHDLAGAYLAASIEQKELFDNLEFQFYMLPVGSCNIGNFLSQNDGWYGQHVYCSIHSILNLYPGISPKLFERSSLVLAGSDASVTVITGPNKPPDESAPETHVTPAVFLHDQVTSYIRDAKRKLYTNIYQAECYEGENLSVTVPFYLSAVLGIKAFARAFQTNHGITHMSIKEMQAHLGKQFKYSPPHLALKFYQMNISGVTRQGPALDARPYTEILLSNIPLHGDPCAPADPSKNWLEMYAVEDTKKKKTRVSDEHFYHISQIEIAQKDKKRTGFHILLDTVLYGPFTMVKITQCIKHRDIDQAYILGHSLPIMTFLPVTL